MAHSRAPVAVIYACGFVMGGSILALMAFFGMFDGLWYPVVDTVKDILRYLLD